MLCSIWKIISLPKFVKGIEGIIVACVKEMNVEQLHIRFVRNSYLSINLTGIIGAGLLLC